MSRKVRLEHWHPQLVKEEAAFVFSTTRQVALSTRVARILAWVNMLGLDCCTLEDENVLELLLIYMVYIRDGREN